MSDLYVIYSPKGEKFEVTRLNFLDLQKSKGWTVEPKAETAIAAAEIATKTVVDPAPVVPAPEPVETPKTVEAPAPVADEAPKVRATVEDFADLESKAEVFEYIEKTFPGNKIDGRANREKLVALAIDLAAQAAA